MADWWDEGDVVQPAPGAQPGQSQLPNYAGQLIGALQPQSQPQQAQPMQPQQPRQQGGFGPGMSPEMLMKAEIAGLVPAGAAKVVTENPQYQIQQRRQAAGQMNLDPQDPATNQYILTGSYPKIEKNYKAIDMADDKLVDINNSLDTAKTALAKNKTSLEGPATSWRAMIGGWVGEKASLDTQAYETYAKMLSQEIAKSNSLGRTNATEQQLMARLIGGTAQPRSVREEILTDVAKHLDNKRVAQEQRADELRSGTYYRPGHQRGGSAAPAPHEMTDDQIKAQLGIK